ncbi:hypothetical protein, partial [Roseovarius tolerans]|uniref:hypothetical protein n=1 Tax=Roseovarius tolerans TaxID=74031 RepID=UPI00128E1026
MAEHDFLEAALGADRPGLAPEAVLPDHDLSAAPASLPLPGLGGGVGAVRRMRVQGYPAPRKTAA